MISVIICSINKSFAEQVKKNISATIGVTCECIIIDNTVSPESIAYVYNSAAARAKHDIVCFVHEDILFSTQNWGLNLIDNFKNDVHLGLIGVAGSKYKSKTPSGWYTGIDKIECCNITHVNSNNHYQKLYFNPVTGSLIQAVVVLDGVFLCCRKKVWNEVKFDDTLLKGFHLYDLDFSLRAAEKYKVVVTFGIDLFHFTEGGNFGDKWIEDTLRWHKKMKNKLPAFISSNEVKIKEFELIILKRWLIRLKHENISFYNQLNWLWETRIWAHISAWPFIVLFMTKKYVNYKFRR